MEFWHARHDLPLRGINFEPYRAIKIPTPVGGGDFYGTPDTIRTCDLQSRSFQASTDKMLCFQGMFSFRRKRPSFLNCCGTIENTGQTGFFGFTGDSSQIVVMQLPVAEKLFQE